MRVQRSRFSGVFGVLVAGALALFAGVSGAQAQSEEPTEGRQQPILYGPADIRIHDMVHLKLPSGYRFIPSPARKPASAPVDLASSTLLGSVTSLGENPQWTVSIAFQPIGFASASVLSTISQSQILEQLKLAPSHQRARTDERFAVHDFVEPPVFDAGAQRFRVVTQGSQTSGASDGDGRLVDFTAYQFGRRGVVRVKLVTPVSEFPGRRQHVAAIASGLSYLAGHRADDAVSDKDPVVEYPLQTIFGGQSAASIKARAAAAAEEAAAVELEAKQAADVKARVERQQQELIDAAASRSAIMVWIGLAVVCLGFGVAAIKFFSVIRERFAKPAPTAVKKAPPIKRVGAVRAPAAG